MVELNQQSLKSKIVEIMQDGYFVATETKYNHGNLMQAFSFASTENRWFKIKFQISGGSKEFTIDVGYISDTKPVGHIGFNIDKDDRSTGADANSWINKNEWLGELLNAKYDPIKTDAFRREFESLPEDSIFHWEVNQRRKI